MSARSPSPSSGFGPPIAMVLAELRERFPELVFRVEVPENVRLKEAPSHHRPITEYAPRSTGAKAYRAAARELEARAR